MFQESSILKEGKMIEKEYLSNVNEVKYKKLFSSLDEIRYKKVLEKDDFKKLFQMVETIQRWPDPSDPDPDFANDLHATIAERLGLKVEEYSNLEFYTAVDSLLDEKGIDAFFKLKLDGKEDMIVSFDLTSNDNKYTTNADVLVHVPSGYLLSRKENGKEYLSKVKEVANDIFKKFNNQIN
ncbi:MAG: hypothetical protein NTY12_02810 [Candidatus Falkowbacteria bacterium]|nr:hypothetical protein [Candidatus Falkowbacteria bacterium]